MAVKKRQARREPDRSIRFLLGDQRIEVSDVDPNTTVLNWLRYQARQTGTKEGCAEGDCGACTVVLGELDGKRIRYRAVNACILFLPTIDGKQLITVEHLAADDGTPHPIQRALVDCHGSQCGFCTPGFVMALFAHYKNDPGPSRDAVNDALAGNLCRCTGYRPIVDAALTLKDAPQDDHFSAREPATIKALRALRRRRPFEYHANGRFFLAPTTVDELAAALKARPDARLLAGGTDVGLWVTKQLVDLDAVIYTGKVGDLRSVAAGSDFIDIGAAATYGDAHAALAADYPDFGEIIRRLGSTQIRNSGTVAGNIGNASPIGDSMPLLIALDTTLLLRRGARRREMPIEEFFVDYRKTRLERGEFIERILVPRARQGLDFRAYKISKRFDQDISAVCGAFAIERQGARVIAARIAFGGMAATPKRARACEQALIGKDWSLATVHAAMATLEDDFQPIDDMRSSARYRMRIAKNLLHKVYLESAAAPPATRVLAYGT